MALNLSSQKIRSSLRLSLAALIVRMIYIPLGIFMWRGSHLASAEFPSWYGQLNLLLLYSIVSIIIWINEDKLDIFYIDKLFLILLVNSGFLLTVSFKLPIFSFISGIVTFITYITYMRKSSKIKKFSGKVFTSTIFLLLGFLPYMLFFILNFPRITGNVSLELIGNVLFKAGFPIVIIEEFIFRGSFYWVLQRKLSNKIIIFLVQVILFWLAHIDYLSNPIAFFVWTPFVSIWLGLVVWRTKSIATSTLFHYIFNVLTFFILY